jgi:hypothetical protein
MYLNLPVKVTFGRSLNVILSKLHKEDRYPKIKKDRS